jgi:hypothetical protein
MKNYRSNRGVPIDLGKLMSQQEKNIAIGNTKSNARGDQLGRGGRVVKGADEIAREHYNKNNPRAVKQTTIKVDDTDIKRKIEEAKSNPDPIIDDWQDPVQEAPIQKEHVQEEKPVVEEDEWVEDAEGNFVRKSELEEANNESVSKSKSKRSKS